MSQMSFDFEAPVVAEVAPRRERGLRAYLSGCAAEDAALRAYEARGAKLAGTALARDGRRDRPDPA